jgi:hypothetical protein
MNLLARILCVTVPIAMGGSLGVDNAIAQTNNAGCVLKPKTGTSRQILQCPRGPTIIAEDGSHFSVVDKNRDGKADAVELQDKALLLDLPRTKTGTHFEVVTPQAIAAVRGTKWAVDVTSGKTSVFVVRGSVSVRKPAGKSGVLVGPGEGVDVDNGTRVLKVTRWPAARVSALLARLGQ